LKGHTERVNSISFSPDGQYIVSGSDDCTLRIWNISNISNPICTVFTIDDYIYSVAFSPNGKYIAASTYKAYLYIYNASKKKLVKKIISKYIDSINSVVFSPNGTHLLTGSADETVSVWDVTNIKNPVYKKLLEKNKGAISSIAFSPDGKRIVASSYNGTICVWDIVNDTYKYKGLIEIDTYDITSIAFSPDGVKIVVGMKNKSNGRLMIIKIDSLLQKEKNKLLEKINYYTGIMSNYSLFFIFFCKYYVEKKSNNTIIKNMNYNIFFEEIRTLLPVNNLSKFADIIIKFITSIPNEPDESFYSGFTSEDTRKFILKNYENIIKEYIKYLNYEFNYISDQNKYYTYTTKRNKELELLYEDLLTNFISELHILKIKYDNEIGQNVGGLSREFFRNLEKQLNLGNGLLNEYIIKILVFSKVNGNPIYIQNDELKEMILKQIKNTIKKHINKNFIYNFLNNQGNIDFQNPSSFLLSGENNLGDIDYNKPAINKYIQNKVNSNKNIKNEYLFNKENKKNLKNLKKLLSNKNSKLIYFIYKNYIHNKHVYKNFLDFYISHFIELALSAEDIINNLTFIDSSIDFENKFKELLRNLSEEELKKFNECISGTSRLQPEYQIKILNVQPSKYSTYHTCFSLMEIHEMKNFMSHFLQFIGNSNKKVIKKECKEAFMETINQTLGSGFSIA